jgi:hypothetical protein
MPRWGYCTAARWRSVAAARSLKPTRAIKRVDRLLSNEAINVDDILAPWGSFRHWRTQLYHGGHAVAHDSRFGILPEQVSTRCAMPDVMPQLVVQFRDC